jgi:hypothetical protein
MLGRLGGAHVGQGMTRVVVALLGGRQGRNANLRKVILHGTNMLVLLLKQGASLKSSFRSIAIIAIASKVTTVTFVACACRAAIAHSDISRLVRVRIMIMFG